MHRAAIDELPERLPEAAGLFYRHWSPRLLTGLAGGSLLTRTVLGGFSLWDLVVALVILALWPIQEWLLHVFLLHYEPRRVFGRTLDFEIPRMHRAHHRDPWRPELVFVPVRVFVSVPIVFAGVLLLGLSAPRLVLSGFAVYYALALHYEWIHFLIHTRYSPKSNYYRRVWHNHRLHHFKNEHYWFGVTMLQGDRLFGTAVRAERVPTSPTCRRLL